MSSITYVPEKVKIYATLKPYGYNFTGSAGNEIAFRFIAPEGVIGGRIGPEYPGTDSDGRWWPLSYLEESDHWIPWDRFVSRVQNTYVRYY